jgi:hypothetical protein
MQKPGQKYNISNKIKQKYKISMFVPKTTDHDLLLRSNKVALDSGYLNAGQVSKQRSYQILFML